MKKSYLIIAFILTIIIYSSTGCEKDPVDTKILLIGSWDQVSLKTVNYYDNVKQTESTKTYDPGYIVLEIYDTGTAKRFIDSKLSDEFYWKVEGDLFIMTGSNSTTLNTVFEVNETDLNLKWAVEESSNGHLLRTDYLSVYRKK